MNHTLQSNLRLLARNEGKIKTHESCSDVRAWSHDLSAKNRYLREWMKCDMPISVIPVKTLTGVLRTMTCKTRGRIAPRCHQNCKSKMLLDSIVTSCHAMKECLRNEDDFEKYFVEDELETSQWPCDKCLDALKSIKMFWKIIVDKIFQIKISKCKEFETDCCSGDSARSVARAWQHEMVHQAVYVKAFTPTLKKVPLLRTVNHEAELRTTQRSVKSCPVDDRFNSNRTQKTRPNHLKKSHEITSEDARNNARRVCKKHSRSINVKVKMIDASCDTCFMEKEHDEIIAHKKNLRVLQEQCNVHVVEVERLKKENDSLKIELQSVYKSCPWKASFCTSRESPIFPKPFESVDENCSGPKNVDSEMIITMKKCKNENFRHVSLLQVLHKTNEPRAPDCRKDTCNNEDPIEILTKVHNTFGAIVKREICIASERRNPKMKKSDIEATFHRVNTSKSAPSCSTLSSRLSSELNFVGDHKPVFVTRL